MPASVANAGRLLSGTRRHRRRPGSRSGRRERLASFLVRTAAHIGWIEMLDTGGPSTRAVLTIEYEHETDARPTCGNGPDRSQRDAATSCGRDSPLHGKLAVQANTARQRRSSRRVTSEATGNLHPGNGRTTQPATMCGGQFRDYLNLRAASRWSMTWKMSFLVGGRPSLPRKVLASSPWKSLFG